MLRTAAERATAEPDPAIRYAVDSTHGIRCLRRAAQGVAKLTTPPRATMVQMSPQLVAVEAYLDPEPAEEDGSNVAEEMDGEEGSEGEGSVEAIQGSEWEHAGEEGEEEEESEEEEEEEESVRKNAAKAAPGTPALSPLLYAYSTLV